MIHEYAIIGGGVAGLCAAIRLTELGAKPLVLEGGSYPSHKVCGEFLSPESLAYLADWNIHPIPIYQAHLRTTSESLTFSFLTHAGGLSHLLLDPALANFAQARGAVIQLHAQVEEIIPKSGPKQAHQIKLGSGEHIQAKQLIIATGRIPSHNFKSLKFKYIGIKAHFKGISIKHTLEMFSFPGTYLGIAPVGEETYNVACLADIQLVQRAESIEKFMHKITSQHPLLKEYMASGQCLFPAWMHAPIPSFGRRSTPDWLDTYFIGDAAITVPPACGDGLSLAVIGGYLAAEYAIYHRAADFKAMWSACCSSQLVWSKALHYAMMRPSLGNILAKGVHLFPFLAYFAFKRTRPTLPKQ